MGALTFASLCEHVDGSSVFPTGLQSIRRSSTRLLPAPAIANGFMLTLKGRSGKVLSAVRSRMAI